MTDTFKTPTMKSYRGKDKAMERVSPPQSTRGISSLVNSPSVALKIAPDENELTVNFQQNHMHLVTKLFDVLNTLF